MVSERELIGLLYRADWTKLALTAMVTGAEPVLDTDITVQSDEPLSGPWRRADGDPPPWRPEDAGPPLPPGLSGHVPPWMVERLKEKMRGARRERGSGPAWTFEPGGESAVCTLSVAPGRRFRAEGADGSWALGSDGARIWHRFRDLPSDAEISFGFLQLDDWPRAPYRALLAPSWLLARYSLVLDGEETVAGRAGVRVRGTVRTVAARPPTWFAGRLGRNVGGLFAPVPRWMSFEHRDDEVEAVVDTELGILLRCSDRSADGPPRVTEFLSVEVADPAEASRFDAPQGSAFIGKGFRSQGPGGQPAEGKTSTSLGDALGEALGTAGKEAAKTAAGLAAGGLGALIRYAPRLRHVDPFARATAEDPEAQMPADDPAPDGPDDATASVPRDEALADEALTDEVLHLVYRSGLAAPRFSATLHQWFDPGAVLAAVPPSARGAGFGGVGFLVDAVLDAAREAAAGGGHGVSSVRMGGWKEYRIDYVRSMTDPPAGRSGRLDKDRPLTVASDGTRQWQVFAERVFAGPAGPPPGDVADLVDASWLLDRNVDLSGGTEVWLAGRRGYRIAARYREGTLPGMDWWARLFFPVVAVVDAETGMVLRLTRFKGGRPALRQELRDVAALDAGTDFGFTPPAGLRVFDGESPVNESGPRPWP